LLARSMPRQTIGEFESQRQQVLGDFPLAIESTVIVPRCLLPVAGARKGAGHLGVGVAVGRIAVEQIFERAARLAFPPDQTQRLGKSKIVSGLGRALVPRKYSRPPLPRSLARKAARPLRTDAALQIAKEACLRQRRRQ
jgi:hypothetical protein